MNELGFDVTHALDWFPVGAATPYRLIRVSEETAAGWAEAMGVALRRCYVTDAVLEERAQALGLTKSEVLASKLPDPGPIMSGDFGEVVAYFYHAAAEHDLVAFGPKKWRLKEARTKPAPYSDVVQFVLPTWPQPSEEDMIICSKVKAKATAGAFSPISAAVTGCMQDRLSRLAKTLVWLRDRAIGENLGIVQLDHLDRFINATDYPPASKRYCAIAVICSTLVDGEIAKGAPQQEPTEYSLIILSVPELREVYTAIYDAARESTHEM
jgi:hypothetical protein